MAAGHPFVMGRRLLAASAVLVLPILSAWSGEPGKKAQAADETAARLVQSALESELAGKDARRDALLQRALEIAPDNPQVHWQLGEVRLQGKWMSPADAAKAAQTDKRLTEYTRRRDAAGPTVADQAALARWCRKNRLDDQQRVHWLSVLQRQPDNAEAIQAFGLRPYQGKMLTAAQIGQLQSQQRRVRKAADQWRLLVAQWRNAAEARDPEIPAALREKLAQIADPAEIIALEADLWRQVGTKRQTRLYGEMTQAMMPVLGGNPQPAAAESLARYAAFSAFPDVRAAAVAGLRRRPLDHYAPLLLSGLQSPVEASMQCRLSATGELIASYSLFQEGALADVSSSLMISPANSPLDPVTSAPSVSVTPGTGTVVFDSPQERQLLMRSDPGYVAAAYAQARAEAAEAAAATAAMPTLVANAKAANEAAAAANWQANAMRSRTQAAQNAAALRDAVDRANRAIAQRNAQIVTVLSKATGLKLGDQPMDWWAWWWQDYNEMYNVGGATGQSGDSRPRKPEYGYENRLEYAGSSPMYLPVTAITIGSGPIPCSCFAPGTKVWTLGGRQPIEKIKPGDCVLAQDVETGEMAYKPVLARTVRWVESQMEVGLGGETITATPSHPFWVCGQGWRMTKQLKVGQRVHTPSGGVAIESIEKVESDEPNAGYAYNLIVADFDSYFVGDRGILVHDNTPRRPTAALVPALIAQAPTANP